MLRELSEEAAAVGLTIHAGKTNILSNAFGGPTTSHTQIWDMKIEELSPHEDTMYLGRALCCTSTKGNSNIASPPDGANSQHYVTHCVTGMCF